MPRRGGGLLQGVDQPGGQAAVAFGRNAHGQGDAVGGQKAHALHILHQAVGVLLDYLARALAVHLADLHRHAGRYAVGLQKDHGLPGGVLLAEAVADLLGALYADARHLAEAVRLLAEDIHGFQPELLHNQPRGGRAYAANKARCQIPLDAKQGGGRQHLAAGGLELPAVLRMLHPLSLEHRLLARGHLGHHAHHGDVFAPGAHGQHGVTVFGVAKGRFVYGCA